MYYNHRGVAKKSLNLLNEARIDYQKTLSLDPYHEAAKTNLTNL